MQERGEWLTTDEVANELKVNVQTVRRWANDGTLPALNLGSRSGGYRIKRADLEAFVAARYRPAKQTEEAGR